MESVGAAKNNNDCVNVYECVMCASVHAAAAVPPRYTTRVVVVVVVVVVVRRDPMRPGLPIRSASIASQVADVRFPVLHAPVPRGRVVDEAWPLTLTPTMGWSTSLSIDKK